MCTQVVLFVYPRRSVSSSAWNMPFQMRMPKRAPKVNPSRAPLIKEMVIKNGRLMKQSTGVGAFGNYSKSNVWTHRAGAAGRKAFRASVAERLRATAPSATSAPDTDDIE